MGKDVATQRVYEWIDEIVERNNALIDAVQQLQENQNAK